MTTQQATTINQIKAQIQKFSPWATEEKMYPEMYGYPSNWIGFVLSDRSGEQYANVVINSKGRIKRGSYDKLRPIK